MSVGFISNSIARSVWASSPAAVHQASARRGCRAGQRQPPLWRQGTGSCLETRQQPDRSLADLVRFTRKALVRCQQDGIGSLAGSEVSQQRRRSVPPKVGRLPMTEKHQAECTIESDATGVFVVFVVFEGVRIAKRGEPGTPPYCAATNGPL
jgi:hypothetical protein